MENVADILYKKVESQYLHLKSLNAQQPYHTKYIDVDLHHWLEVGLERYNTIKPKPKSSILDLGSGLATFPAVCQYYGHSVLTTDIYNPADIQHTRVEYCYNQIISGFDLPYQTWRIRSHQKTPIIGKFDYITAFCAMFSRKPDKKPFILWNAADWKFFSNDLVSLLNPNGQIWLYLNPDLIDPDVSEFFNSIGTFDASLNLFKWMKAG